MGIISIAWSTSRIINWSLFSLRLDCRYQIWFYSMTVCLVSPREWAQWLNSADYLPAMMKMASCTRTTRRPLARSDLHSLIVPTPATGRLPAPVNCTMSLSLRPIARCLMGRTAMLVSLRPVTVTYDPISHPFTSSSWECYSSSRQQ